MVGKRLLVPEPVDWDTGEAGLFSPNPFSVLGLVNTHVVIPNQRYSVSVVPFIGETPMHIITQNPRADFVPGSVATGCAVKVGIAVYVGDAFKWSASRQKSLVDGFLKEEKGLLEMERTGRRCHCRKEFDERFDGRALLPKGVVYIHSRNGFPLHRLVWVIISGEHRQRWFHCVPFVTVLLISGER